MKKTALALLCIGFLFASCVKEKCAETIQPVQKTITIQPGAAVGKDAFVTYHASSPASAESNMGNSTEMDVYSWTNNGSVVSSRTFISFPFDSIPAGAEIISAKLTVYGVGSSPNVPQGNSGDNKLYVQRVIQSWSENSITWNNQPAVTADGQAITNGSTSQWNYALDSVDVSSMVKTMITAGSNYGFCLKLVTEQAYRSIVFASSDAEEAAKRPRLVVVYKK